MRPHDTATGNAEAVARALDANGHPTTDTDKGSRVFLLPMGGHKGYGLALAAGISCGVLTGSGFQSGAKEMYRESAARREVGDFMVAIKYFSYAPAEEWSMRMAGFAEMVKSSPM